MATSRRSGSRALLRTLRRPPVRIWVALSWLAWFGGAELFGRRAKDETQDALGVLGLVMVLVFNVWLHHRHGNPLVQNLGRGIERLARRLRPAFPLVGVDLRREPPLRTGLPTVFFAVLIPAWGLVLMRPLLGEAPLAVLRDGLIAASPSLAFLVEAALWGTFAVGILLAGVLALATLYMALQRTRLPQREDFRWLFGMLGAAYLGTFAVLASVLPTWAPFAVLAVVFVAIELAVEVFRTPSLLYLWRPPAQVTPMRVCEMRIWNHATGFSMLGVALGLGLLALETGEGLSGSRGPVSAHMGLILGWAAVAIAPMWAWLAGTMLLYGHRRDPAQPAPLQLHVHGVERAQRRELRRMARKAGFGVQWAPKARKREHVPIELRAGAAFDAWAPRSWPLALDMGALEDPGVRACLEQRDRQQRRRHLVRGLQRAFKEAGRRFEAGSGFLVAPHLWFLEGLTRDVDDPDHLDVCVGTRFHKLIPLAARHHFHQVMRAQEVDILFVEDGVRFSSLRQVLRRLFDLHDRQAGRALSRHFSGLPKVHVVVDDYGPERPWLEPRLPEPDYEDVARARILTIFRDRGEDEAIAPRPFEWDSAPSPGTPLTLG